MMFNIWFAERIVMEFGPPPPLLCVQGTGLLGPGLQIERLYHNADL